MPIVIRYIFYGYREKNGHIINTFFFFSSREKKLSNLSLKYVVRFDYQEKKKPITLKTNPTMFRVGQDNVFTQRMYII